MDSNLVSNWNIKRPEAWKHSKSSVERSVFGEANSSSENTFHLCNWSRALPSVPVLRYSPCHQDGGQTRVLFGWMIIIHRCYSLGIQSPRMAMEPKYYAFRRWLDTQWAPRLWDWCPVPSRNQRKPKRRRPLIFPLVWCFVASTLWSKPKGKFMNFCLELGENSIPQKTNIFLRRLQCIF